MFPHVSTEALVCAVVLSEEGNIGRTAERLHTSNTNVGRKVKMLQKGWGVVFFHRTMYGFELTEEGRSAMREVRKALEGVQCAFDRAIYSTVKNRRPFRIGYSLYIHGKILPFLEKQTTPSADFSRIALKTDTTVHLKARVLRGDLHLGFGVMPILDKDLWVAPVAHENFSVCIPDTHPLKDKERLSAHDLANETLYWMPRFVHPAFYDQVTDYLIGVGHDLHNLHEAGAITQGIDLAAAKFGVALVPQSASRFQCPGVLFKPLTDKLLRMRTLRLIAAAAFVLVSACNDAGKATNANFTTAINRYLDHHGLVCTIIGPQFPVDIPRSQQSSVGGKLAALQHAGLVSETDTTAVVHGLMDALRGPSSPQPVRHYALTAEGEKYIQQVSGAVIPTSSFCYGQKTVDSITHWTTGSQSAAEATYTYRIVSLATWAQRPEVQQAFPDVQATLSGASKTEQTIGLQLTEKGWTVP